ncbi:expressed unknown protein [Seminavis robusta]|uniref:Ethylene receptor 1-like N-terminal domain-containing protein n=1 Tax=Seminavis robusta TaxID=568900 RepID=A0A9N8HCP1_9STRA|nr:expressed unknown protein [Seminavis robusta]|eukprot:Sro310_g114060.1 n/a (140) ;mRNA; f:36868-37287
MKLDDLIITIAYFSIPVQLVASLAFYPRLISMPPHVLGVFILVALFILCCGTGHLLRCADKADTTLFHIVQWITAGVSIFTAVVLLPMIPLLMSEVDEGLERMRKLDREAAQGDKYTAMNIMSEDKAERMKLIGQPPNH